MSSKSLINETDPLTDPLTASTGRYYQLFHSTNLNHSPAVSNLGWGIAPTMSVTGDVAPNWFGGVNVSITNFSVP